MSVSQTRITLQNGRESDLSREGRRFANAESKYDPTLTEQKKYSGYQLFGRLR